MAKIFRTMTPDGDKPLVGDKGRHLGVRVPQDIEPAQDGTVCPDIGGMSVAPSIAELPAHRIPVRLRARHPKAMGNTNDVVWCHGEGDWAESVVSCDLNLRLDPSNPSTHGLVEPAKMMRLEAYRDALAATRDQWTNAESTVG